jgi:hypothetical protein
LENSKLGVSGVCLVSILNLGRYKTLENINIMENEKMGVSGACFVTILGFRTFQNMGKLDLCVKNGKHNVLHRSFACFLVGMETGEHLGCKSKSTGQPKSKQMTCGEHYVFHFSHTNLISPCFGTS